MTKYNVPYTFKAGTKAKASEVNANFDYVVEAANELHNDKANINGDTTKHFSAADPISASHVATKRYVDLHSGGGEGGGSGVGKTLFEIFTTLSRKTPAGAFSLRTGELIADAEDTYISFYDAVRTNGKGIIKDLTDVSALPDGYSITLQNVDEILGGTGTNDPRVYRAFGPYTWCTVKATPSTSRPTTAILEFDEAIVCDYFKINSHVFDTAYSIPESSSKSAIKKAKISIRTTTGNWIEACTFNEDALPKKNARYYPNEQKALLFDAIKIEVYEVFASNLVDLSVYPVDSELQTIRLVTEDQWQFELQHFGQTGAFVLDEVVGSVRLPKVNGFIYGVADLWSIGEAVFTTIGGGDAVSYESGSSTLVFSNTDSEDAGALVTTGLSLWIQVYNTVADSALATMKYVPHSVLFEERPFRFVPSEVTGYFLSDGSWRDGHYFSDAYDELRNSYATAIELPDKRYMMAADGKKFVDAATYESVFNSTGEVPYYVLDVDNYRFRTPVSNSYIRYSNTIDNVGPADKIKAVAPSADDPTVDITTSNYVMCVFLGNEVPTTSAIDIMQRLKTCENSIEEIQEKEQVIENIQSDISGIQSDISELQTAVGKIPDNTSMIELLFTKLDALDERVTALEEAQTS